jgi:hypothetical protein
MHKIFWSENLKGRENAVKLGVDGKIILESSFFLNCLLLPCGVEGFLLVNLLHN